MTIEKEFPEGLRRLDQRTLLEAIHCPLLLIHGEGGEDEAQLKPHSHKALTYLHPDSRLKVIPRATHDFAEHMDTVISLTLDWFQTHLETETDKDSATVGRSW